MYGKNPMPDGKAANRFKGIVRLDQASDEQLKAFDCGKTVLNNWLVTRARANDVNGGSRTYLLITGDDRVAGYFCLSNYALVHEEVKASVRRNMPNPIPATLLGRLAVSSELQGQDIGSSLLRYAVSLAVKVAEFTNSAVLVTEPIDESAFAFYRMFGFEPVKAGASLLMLRLHAVREIIGR